MPAPPSTPLVLNKTKLTIARSVGSAVFAVLVIVLVVMSPERIVSQIAHLAIDMEYSPGGRVQYLATLLFRTLCVTIATIVFLGSELIGVYGVLYDATKPKTTGGGQ